MSELQAMIEDYRLKLMEVADDYGLTSPQTIECSQQLDQLLNELISSEQK